MLQCVAMGGTAKRPLIHREHSQGLNDIDSNLCRGAISCVKHLHSHLIPSRITATTAMSRSEFPDSLLSFVTHSHSGGILICDALLFVTHFHSLENLSSYCYVAERESHL